MSFILIILSFNFIGSLSILILEKKNDIKTLNYLGLSHLDIRTLFLIVGVGQGLLGGSIGLMIGLIICWVQKIYGVIPMPGNGTFVINAYPIDIKMVDICIIFLLIISISFLASILILHIN